MHHVRNVCQAVTHAAMSESASSSVTVEEGPGWYVEVTPLPLALLKYTTWVTVPEAGAVSTFIGTTRNSFDGKAVLKLEYEAYVPMAVKKIKVPSSSPSTTRHHHGECYS